MAEDLNATSKTRFGSSAYRRSSTFQRKTTIRKQRVMLTQKHETAKPSSLTKTVPDPSSHEINEANLKEREDAALRASALSNIGNELGNISIGGEAIRESTDLHAALHLDNSEQDTSFYLEESNGSVSTYSSLVSPARRDRRSSNSSSSMDNIDLAQNDDKAISFLSFSSVGGDNSFNMLFDEKTEASRNGRSVESYSTHEEPANEDGTFNESMLWITPTKSNQVYDQSKVGTEEESPARSTSDEESPNWTTKVNGKATPVHSLTPGQLLEWINPKTLPVASSDAGETEVKSLERTSPSDSFPTLTDPYADASESCLLTVKDKENSIGLKRIVSTPDTVACSSTFSPKDADSPLGVESIIRMSNLLNVLDNEARLDNDGEKPQLDETSISSNITADGLPITVSNVDKMGYGSDRETIVRVSQEKSSPLDYFSEAEEIFKASRERTLSLISSSRSDLSSSDSNDKLKKTLPSLNRYSTTGEISPSERNKQSWTSDDDGHHVEGDRKDGIVGSLQRPITMNDGILKRYETRPQKCTNTKQSEIPNDFLERAASDLANNKLSLKSLSHKSTTTKSTKRKAKSSTTKSTKIFGGLMYHDITECAAILSMVESKRRCWFQNELESSWREWNHYKKWLRQSVRELTRMETLVQCSFIAFDGYSKAISAICNGAFVNDNGDFLTKKERAKLLQQRGSETVGLDGTPLLDPVIKSLASLSKELKTQVPPMKENVNEASELKTEITVRAKELKERGNTLGMTSVERAEASIREAFDSLMKVTEWYEKPRPKDDIVPECLKDRWLLESRYRNAAYVGLLIWKENRRDYQKIYAEIIQLDDDRKSGMKQLLLSFLPRRKKLMDSAHCALTAGTVSLDEPNKSRRKETDEIECVLKGLSLPSSTTKEQFGSIQKVAVWDEGKGKVNCYLKAPGLELWESPYVKERRLVELKLGRGWKTAISVITLDNYLHVFVAAVDSKTAESSVSGIYDANLQEVALNLKVPVPEFSVKLAEFDITIMPDATVIELLRRGRSKLFRKRDDQIMLRLESDDAAADWVHCVRFLMEISCSCRLEC